MTALPPVVVVRGKHLFGSEIKAAKKLGFQLRLILDRPGVVLALLVPTTPRARHLCKAQGAEAIEAQCAVEDESHRMDAARDTIAVALRMAKDAGA